MEGFPFAYVIAGWSSYSEELEFNCLRLFCILVVCLETQCKLSQLLMVTFYQHQQQSMLRFSSCLSVSPPQVHPDLSMVQVERLVPNSGLTHLSHCTAQFKSAGRLLFHKNIKNHRQPSLKALIGERKTMSSFIDIFFPFGAFDQR